MAGILGWLTGATPVSGAVEGAAKGAVSVVEGVANVIDKFVETDDEKRVAELIKQRLALKPSEAQWEINKIEAGHASIFVAGWRPFIGWVCGFALAYSFIVRELIIWILKIFSIDIEPPPPVAFDYLMELVLAMLGLAGLRTAEKATGATK